MDLLSVGLSLWFTMTLYREPYNVRELIAILSHKKRAKRIISKFPGR